MAVGFFKKRRLNKYTNRVQWYILKNFEPEEKPGESWEEIQRKIPVVPPEELAKQTANNIKYSISPLPESKTQDRDNGERYSSHETDLDRDDSSSVRFSDRDGIPNFGDRFMASSVRTFMSQNSDNPRLNKLASKLDNYLNLTFVDMLTRYINEKGWRDSKVYKAAQMDRRLFSKIMSDQYYKPSKDSALALAIALELTLKQTNDLLSRAGYTLSHSDKRDVIIEYFIREGIYNLSDINEILYRLDQKIIGR